MAAVSGVEGVESCLRVGLLPSDTRPSDGAHQQPPSAALRELLGAATGTGPEEQHAPPALRATFSRPAMPAVATMAAMAAPERARTFPAYTYRKLLAGPVITTTAKPTAATTTSRRRNGWSTGPNTRAPGARPRRA